MSSTTEVTGRLLVDGAWVPGTLVLEHGRVVARRPLDGDVSATADLPLVAPGLVDLHVHGFGGCDPLRGLVDGVAPFAGERGERGGGGASADPAHPAPVGSGTGCGQGGSGVPGPDPDGGLAGMARALARAGTTAFQPTLFPADPARLGAASAACWSRALELRDAPGHARVLGLHLEGPFVNPLAAGALPPEDLAAPSPAALAALLGPATGDGRGVRTLTLAPELAGADGLLAELERVGVRASFGHSRATAAEARAALGERPGDSGAPYGVTHLFNAMTGLHHRDPGLAALALTDEALVVELIGDLVHVGPEAIDLALRARGPAGLALVSDALEGAGTGCDVFHSHGRVHRCHGGAAWYPADDDPLAARDVGSGSADGDVGTAGTSAVAEDAPEPRPERLAGSATGQLEAVRRLVHAGLVTPAEALTMATLAPARALGLEGELGTLDAGARADLVVLDPVDLTLRRVLVGGIEVA